MPTLVLDFLLLALALPLAASVALLFLGSQIRSAAGYLATIAMGGSFLGAVLALVVFLQSPLTPPPEAFNFSWIPLGPGLSAGSIDVGVFIDGLTLVMTTMITGVALLVTLYSTAYMALDPRFTRFFAYLCFFVFSMLGLVLASSLVQMLVFWELVGLTSYLLIGFWHEKKAAQLASRKAMIMNRIGDAGMIIGIGILFQHLGGQLLLPCVDGGIFESLQRHLHPYDPAHPPLWLTLAGIGLFCGAIGKSAQFPLHTWLPDAMEGPTPVSSIIHSATMVGAGVYLTARIYPILTPQAHLFICLIGLITLVMGALMALVNTDIKRVLAYSTLSQLGYMVLGLGAGAYSFALFHLITHAFFKCCLFQCAGSVIHAAHHEQDMTRFGGLYRKMPVTAVCYLVCTLAISGASIPFLEISGHALGTSGFYSKEGLIAGLVVYAQAAGPYLPGAWLFFVIPIGVSYLTAFYMARSFTLTFLGKPRVDSLHEHAHEAPWQMLLPQVVLAAPYFLPFLSLINGSAPEGVSINPDNEKVTGAAYGLVHHATLFGTSWILAAGAGVALYLPGTRYAQRIAGLPLVRVAHQWILRKFFFDSLYDNLVVSFTWLTATAAYHADRGLIDIVIPARFVSAVARTLQRTHSGNVRGYVVLVFSALTLGVLVVLTVMAWKASP